MVINKIIQDISKTVRQYFWQDFHRCIQNINRSEVSYFFSLTLFWNVNHMSLVNYVKLKGPPIKQPKKLKNFRLHDVPKMTVKENNKAILPQCLASPQPPGSCLCFFVREWLRNLSLFYHQCPCPDSVCLKNTQTTNARSLHRTNSWNGHEYDPWYDPHPQWHPLAFEA